MYSQYDEEPAITGYFAGVPGPHRFLDIGAYDGKKFSNTYRLVELGWPGVCVEPSVAPFHSLLDLHRDNPGIVLVNAAVTLASALQEFQDTGGDAISSFDAQHVQKWKGAGGKFRAVLVKTITMQELLDAVGYDFTFISIDVEGLSLALLAQLPLDRLPKLRLICIEHDGRVDAVRSILKGWREVFRNAENIILARN